MFYDARTAASLQIVFFVSNNSRIINYFKNTKRLEILMVFLCKCISTKNTEQIVNPIIIVFEANAKVFKKIKVDRIEKLQSEGCCS